jgi:hypothetical protein
MAGTRAPGRFKTLAALSLASTAVLGLINLPQPFHGDQALFTIAARELDGGRVLYRDFWDLKPPGIFVFYLVAGRLFGFSEAGVHLFELLYLLAFAAFLLVTLKDRFRRPEIAALLPLLTVGFYYAVAKKWHLTQVEGLVGPLLYVSLWFGVGHREEKRRVWIPRLLASGLAGGLVLLFKPMFGLILLPFWWSAILLVPAPEGRMTALVVLRRGTLILAGVGLAVAPVVAYFVRHECLDLAWKTLFVIPPQVLGVAPRKSVLDFVRNAGWFGVVFAPLIALALPALRTLLQKPRDLLFANLVAWLVLGTIVILLQMTSWWAYHFLLLAVPIGLLSSRGIEGVIDRWQAGLPRAATVGAALGFFVLCVPCLYSLARKAVDLGVCGFALDRKHAEQYRIRVSPDYRAVAEETAFLSSPDALPGGIWVGGDPLFYYLSGREQAIALSGWSPEFYIPDQWAQLEREIKPGKAAYLFFLAELWNWLPQTHPELRRSVDERYQLLRRSDAGYWFARR